MRRERLLVALDGPRTGAADGSGRVVVVTGPAGAGKTTLIADWLASRTERRGGPRAWVTASPDEDVHSLWSALISAIDAADVCDGPSPLAGLDAPRGVLTDDVLAAVVDAVESMPEPLCLVVEDVHEIHDPAAVHSLELLLRNLPKHLELVLSARYVPERTLARLRLDGVLTEIDGRDLAFTADEVRALLERHGLTLDPQDAQRLLVRTDGWAAGLRLAIPTMLRATDPRTFIDDFAGDDRAVADYLVGEVLARTPPDVLDLMLRTAVCDELDAQLATALSGREDAGAVLHELERTNGLVARLDGRGSRYRYHGLLRDYLLAELHRRGPVGVHQAHSAAARWFATHGEPLQALHHAAEAEDQELVRALVHEHGLDLVLEGSGGRLRRHLARCRPRTEDEHDEEVDLIESLAALTDGDVMRADEILAGIDPDTRPDHDGYRTELEHLARGLAALRHGHFEAARRQVSGPTVSSDQMLRELASMVGAWVHLARGDPTTAEPLIRDAAELAAVHDHAFGRLQAGVLDAVLAGMRCDVPRMVAAAGSAVGFAAAHGWPRAPRVVHAHLVRGWAGYAAMEDEATAVGVSEALELLGDRPDPATELSARALAALHLADRESGRGAALTRLTALWDGPLPVGAWLPLRAGIPIAVQQLALALGRRATADHLLDRAVHGLGDVGEVRVLQAVQALDRGHPDVAVRNVTPVLDGSCGCLVASTVVSAALVRCRSAVRMGADVSADDALRLAVEVAAPLGLVRPFHDAGSQVRDRLDRDVGRFGAHEEFVEQVRLTIGRRPDRTSPALTDRERTVLRELPTLSTNEEIAASLSVSVNTVKTHLRSIYRKVGATTRREALVRARQLGLL